MTGARIVLRKVLSKVHHTLEEIVIERQRSDGKTQQISREIFNTGHAMALLPYDPERGKILLIRQFRFPVFLDDRDGFLVEACAGKLEGDTPEVCAVREAEEEMGYRIRNPVRIFDAFMSPGSMMERLSFFVARYSPADKVSAGGGLAEEGEDIEVFETTLDEAIAMIDKGEIMDSKTINLLYYAKLKGLLPG